MEAEDEHTALTVVTLSLAAALLCVLLLVGGAVTLIALLGLAVVGFLLGYLSF